MEKLESPAFLRNAEPISEVLSQFLKPGGWVLETASGPGQHLVYFAEKFPEVAWKGSDRYAEAVHSIDAWSKESRAENFLPSQCIDVGVINWWKDVDVANAPQAILNINMAHISPWECTKRFVEGANEILNPGGYLYFYGPWWEADSLKAPSNLSFDESLRYRNPEWGIRSTDDLQPIVEENFELIKTVKMPANNISMIFKKR